jgi:hypothetical protein
MQNRRMVLKLPDYFSIQKFPNEGVSGQVVVHQETYQYSSGKNDQVFYQQRNSLPGFYKECLLNIAKKRESHLLSLFHNF